MEAHHLLRRAVWAGLAAAALATTAHAQVDPGVRGGGPGAGLAFADLTDNEQSFFEAGLEDFEEAEGVRLRPEDWEEEVDTLGGLVFMLTNRVPARGEVITHPEGHEFEVVDADARKVKRLRVSVGRPLTATGAVGQAAE